MNELSSTQYDKVRPLVKQGQVPGFSSYAFSILEGRQKGHIFVDDVEYPQSALVINLAAPALVCGAANSDGFEVFLQEFIQGLPENQMLGLWTASEAWHRVLATLSSVPWHRIVFTYHPSPACKVLQAGEDDFLPSGFRLRRIDETLARNLQESMDPWGINIWGGPAGFVQGSVGFCAVRNGRIGSSCTAAFVGDGAVEISITTDADFRRQGLGEATCRALINHCLTHNLRPDWSCNSNNSASAALAEKLGFVRRGEIQGYLLNGRSWTS